MYDTTEKSYGTQRTDPDLPAMSTRYLGERAEIRNLQAKTEKEISLLETTSKLHTGKDHRIANNTVLQENKMVTTRENVYQKRIME